MGVRSYLDDLDEADEDLSSPYQAITDRQPLEDMSLSGIASSSPGSLVKDAIARKFQGAPAMQAPAPGTDYSAEPLMQEFEKQQEDIQGLRAEKLHADLAANFAQAGAQAAQGANRPTASTIPQNLSTQAGDLLKGQQGDLDRRQKVISAIEGRKSREAGSHATADYRQSMMKMHQDQINRTEKAKQDRLDSINIGRANSLLQNPNVSKETTKLNAARSVQSLVDGIRSGEITDSKNIRNQLTNMIATIELGSPGGVSDRQHMGIDNLYTRVKDALAFMDSNPNKSIPPEYLSQFESEAHALGDRAAKNYHALTNSILSGADLSGGNPDVEPGKIHQLVSQRRSKFLSENGYDPETGERINKGPEHHQQSLGKTGQLVKVKGKMYRVGADGDTLEEVM